MKIKLIILTAVILASFSGAAQCLVNLKSITTNGNTDTVDNGPIIIDINGKVVVSGNKKINSTQYDASTAQQLSNGIMTWTQTFNLATQKCWVAASATDASGNVYITGGVATGTLNGVDLFIVKYNNLGAQVWSKTYNGPNSTTDVGVAICLDPSNDPYVTGPSDGTLTALIDYVTIKFDKYTGNPVWTSRYDYSGAIDIPGAIAYNSVSKYIEVSGASGTTYNNLDIATVAYYYNTGSQAAVNRIPSAGPMDKAFSMVSDTVGNVYITGSTWNSGNNSYDISIQKLDTLLNQVWIKSWDGNGLEDAGINIAIDDSCNIYVAGTGYYQDSTLSNLIVLKYDSAGNKLWDKKIRQQGTASSAEGIRIKVKNMNEIFVGGNYTKNNNQDIAIMRFDRTGKKTMERTYNGPLNAKDKFLDFVLDPDSNYLYVSGRQYAGTNLDENIVLTYEYEDFVVSSIVNDNPGEYVNNELILCFHPSGMKMTTINDRETQFGRLADFVEDSICNKINAAVGTVTSNAQSFRTRKIFLDMTEADSLSQTRQGDYIRIPKFYTNLTISIPDNYNLLALKDSLNRKIPDFRYCQLNWIVRPTAANDPLYGSQPSIHPTTTYTAGHINVDSAWAITSGRPNVKVGFLDTGIDFGVPDYAGVNWNGRDFVTNQPITPGNWIDDNGHGTSVSGVVGSRRNNNIGIAGIAGGDTDSSNIGASIYDLKVLQYGSMDPNPFGTMPWLSNAIYTGAKGENVGGFALNIFNASMYINEWTVEQRNPIIQDLLNFTNKNGCAFVGSKTNFGFNGGQLNVWPADWNPEIVSCVGSTGNNGHRCILNINCDYSWDYGRNMDFVAPGSASLVTTIARTGITPAYISESGCSFATPHVSGIMALMMSYWNYSTPNWYNLTHEDCEHIIIKTCTDLTVTPTYSETIGYDSLTAYGRVNAYQALKHINKNYYRIRHIDQSHFATTYTTTQSTLYSNYQQYWPDYKNGSYVPLYNPAPLNAGTYSTLVAQLTTTITFTMSPSEKIIGYWPLYRSCNGWNKDTVKVSVDKPYYAKIDTIIGTTAVVKTWLWYNYNMSSWWPTSPYFSKVGFTLYTYDSLGSGILTNVDENIVQGDFKVYPNPSDKQFKLDFYTEFYGLLNYKIFDILGREIKEENFPTVFGKNTININFLGASGVYFLKVYDGKKQVYTQKLIKNE